MPRTRARRFAPATSLGKLMRHTRDAWQVLLLFSYLLAAMTPQVRRALSSLDGSLGR